MYDMREFIYNILSSYHLIFKITQYPEYHHLDILLFSNYLRNFTPCLIQLSSNRGFRCEISQRPGWPTVVKTSKPSWGAVVEVSHGQTLPPYARERLFLWAWYFWYFLLRGRDSVSFFFFMFYQSTVYLWNWTLHVWKDVMPKREAIVFHSHESSLRRQSHHVTAVVLCWNSHLHTTSGKPSILTGSCCLLSATSLEFRLDMMGFIGRYTHIYYTTSR